MAGRDGLRADLQALLQGRTTEEIAAALQGLPPRAALRRDCRQRAEQPDQDQDSEAPEDGAADES